MKRILLLSLALPILLLSCDNSNNSSGMVKRQKVSAVELEAMLKTAGQEYVTTIGVQSEVGPYEVHGSQSGSRNSGTTFDNLRYDFPGDDSEHIARKFRNPDGSAFMKVSRFPERP